MMRKKFLFKSLNWRRLTAGNRRMFASAGILILAGGALIFNLQHAKGAAYTWDGGGADGTCGGAAGDGNKWSCNLNWSSDIVPGVNDTVTFNGTSTKNADITSAVDVQSITIASGYTGTITQVGTNTIQTRASGGINQATGTFTGGSGSITMIGSGAFTLSGGTFTSTTGTFTVNGTWTHTAGGTFNHNSGTVVANAGANVTWDVSTTETLNNFTYNPGTAWTLTIASGDTFVVLGTFTHSDGSINTGTVEPRADVTIGSGADGGTGTISFLVSGDQTITPTSTGATAGLNINKSSGTVSISNGQSMSINAFTLSSGTFSSTSGTLTVRNSWTHTAGGTFTHNNGTVTSSGATAGHTWDVATTETFNNFTMNNIWNLTIGSGDTFVILGTFTHTDGVINTGTIEARSGVSIAATADAGTFTLSFLVAGDQPMTVASGGATGGFNINKPSGIVSIAGGPNLSINAFTLAGGEFSSTSGNLTVRNSWTHTAGGTFTHNSGTVTSSGASAGHTWDVATSETFNNFTINTAWTMTIATSDTLIVAGTLTVSDGTINTGTIEARGNASFASASDTGTATLSFLVTGDQTITPAVGSKTPNFNINKPSGSVNLSGGTNITFASFSQSSGGFSAGTTALTVTGAFSQSGGTFDGGTSTINMSSTFTLSGGTFTSTTNTLGVGSTWTHTAGGTFNHNNGSFTWSAPNATAFNIAAPETFNNATFGNARVALTAGQTIVTLGTVTDPGAINGGFLEARGGVTVTTAVSFVGAGTLAFYTAGDQTITLNGSGRLPQVLVSKPSGQVSFAGATTDVIVGNLTISSGTFVAPTGNLTVSGNFTRANTGVYQHNNGTVVNTGPNNATMIGDTAFYNLTYNSGGRIYHTGTFTVVNNLSVTVFALYTGTIQAQGNVSILTNSETSTSATALQFVGANNQTWSDASSVKSQGTMTINKNAGSKVTMTSDLTYNAASQAFNITSGILDQGATFALSVTNLTIGTNGLLQNLGTGGLTLAGTLANSGTVYMNSNGVACGDTDSILVRSSSNGVQRSWNGSGKFILSDLDVRDMAGSATIVTTSSTSTSNNGANWTFNATCPPVVSAPNGSENWATRTAQTISWSAYSGVDHYRLFYSTDSGASWTQITTTTGTTSSWTLPSINSSKTRVLVAAENVSNVVLAQDMSDADFTIVTSGTTLNGGIQFNGGVTF